MVDPRKTGRYNEPRMKITAKARYGLRILLDIALFERTDHPRTIHEISVSQGISEKFISRLVVPLRAKGMIRSVRGKQGGFRLARAPEDITLLDVLEALEGEVSVVDCVACEDACERAVTCAARSVWLDVNEAVKQALRSLTLVAAIERHRGGGTVPAAVSEYFI